MTDFEALVDQVLDIDNSKDRHDVLIDLKYTKSVEATINRIFDGQFLKGTLQDPLEILNQTSTEQFIVLDSDEEEPSAK
ncbi:hypothetical protein BD560DRAFT_210507 [Blakeslea trispora]|nr:hypothetical protein BD560DRAFT_210507 [Blakeslea trispora]